MIEEKGQCEYEEIITTQVQKETTIITTFTIQETTSEISKMTTQIDTTSIASTVVTGIADSSAIVTSIADDRNGISSIVDSSADISSTNLGSTAISSIADSSIAFTTSSIYSTDMGRIDISTAILNEIDTTYKTKYSVSSSELDIRTSNMESNVNIVTSTFYSERYGCLSNPLTLRCSMTQTSNNTQIYNLVVTNILSNYKGDNLKSIVFEGEDDTIFQVTSAKNELDLLMNGNLSENYNISIIDFSECEKILKEHYHVAEEDSLIFIKQEKITDKESDKNIQYECYEPYNFTKLNLSLCSRVSINIYVPLTISEETKKMAEEMDKLGYNIFNLNDRFYKDMCTPYKSKIGTDIVLSDRVDYIYNNLDAQCQSNCKFVNYALDARYINCDCTVQEETISAIQVKKIDPLEPKSILHMFYFVLKYSNYKVVFCYKLVFVKRVLTKNLGSIFIYILFFLYLMCLIAHITRGIIPLKTIVRPIIVDRDKIIHLYFPPRKKKSFIKPKGKDRNKNFPILETEDLGDTEEEDNKKEKKIIRRIKLKVVKLKNEIKRKLR